jgi:DNA-binding FadR family transcriptional regulator
MQRVVHLQRDMRTPSVTLQSHKDIANAVIDGDQQRARAAMLWHCSGGLPILQAIVADESRRLDAE